MIQQFQDIINEKRETSFTIKEIIIILEQPQDNLVVRASHSHP